jgi:phospholipid N-methyltransferase
MGKPYLITENPTEAAGFEAAPGSGHPSLAGDAWHFVSNFVRNPRTIGAVAPSSRKLAEAMLPPVDLRTAKVVVEVGAGTGAITGRIMEAIAPDAALIAIELNPDAVERLRRRFPRIHAICDSVEHLPQHLDLLGHGQADSIVSSLPWSTMTTDLQRRLLDSVVASLKPGGSFSTMAYLHASNSAAARSFKTELERHFGEITSSKVVWANIPPAFAYYGRRPRVA